MAYVDFFADRRDWSEIKDSILTTYMPPYLKKVAKLDRPILLVDAFAGKGRFDGGEPGSPLILCETAEKMVPGRYFAIFSNKKKAHHDALRANIAAYERRGSARAVYGDARNLLAAIGDVIRDHTVFVYLDPLGISGCDFDLIRPLLERTKYGHSTELLINLSMPVMHRLAARKARKAGRSSPMLDSWASILDGVLGGTYWREHLWCDGLESEEREQRVVEAYKRRLAECLSNQKYVVSCPVREKAGRRTKYHIIFCSRHPDALVLMNDQMGDAYNDYMKRQEAADLPLFSPVHLNWKQHREEHIRQLCGIVPVYVERHHPRLSRSDLWPKIVEDHFMRFRKPDYREAVKRLAKTGALVPKTLEGEHRLNKDSILYLPHDVQHEHVR